ncbi:MAG: M48 family metalloprotease [Cyanobacteria bacterium J06635_1]
MAGLLALAIGTAQAQEWPGDDGFYEDYAGTDTYLVVSFLGDQSAFLNLYFYPENPELIQVGPLQSSLEQVLGCGLTQRTLQTDESYYWDLAGYCRPGLGGAAQAFAQPAPQPWGKQQGQLNLIPLIESLKAQNFETLELTLTPPDRGNLQVTPEGESYPLAWMSPTAQIYDLTLTAPEVTQIRFSFGYAATDIGQRVGALGLFLLVPVGILFWLRQRALAFKGEDKAPIWFSFQRSLASLIPLMWMGWLVGFIVADVRTWLPTVLGSDAAWLHGVEQLCFFGPPMLALLVCYGLSHRVFKEIGQWDYALSELLLQVVISQLALLLPVLCVVFGFSALANGQMQLMGVLLIGAIASRLILNPMLQKLRDMTPHAITTGELRDRIFALAKPAGVKLNQVYVLPMKRSRMLNAFAVSGGNVMLTDYLIKHLSKAEVDAVMAHEIAHLQYGHIRKKVGALVVLSLTTLVLTSLTFAIFMHGGTWRIIVPVVCFGLSLVCLYTLSRRFEYQADAQAALLTTNPQAMMTGLVKLARLNQIPLQWGRWSESWMTHPSIQRRIEALARRYDMPATALDTLIKATDAQADYYSVPTVADEASPIFSSQVKQRIVQRLAWAQILTLTLLPAGLARCVVGLGLPTPGLQWLGYLAGIVIIVAVMWRVMDAGPIWGFDTLRQQLAARLQQNRLDPEQGLFVSFAPNADLCIYEGFVNWDICYLFMGHDSASADRSGRLVYVGEQTQFALAPQDITHIYLSPWRLGWGNAPKLCLTWKAGAQTGTFNLQPAQVRTLTQGKLAVCELKQRLESWQANPVHEPVLPDVLMQIKAPNIGEVTSTPLANLVGINRFIRYWLLLLLVGLTVSALMGLLSTGLGPIFYVLGCSTVGAIAQFIPLWRNTKRTNSLPNPKSQI